MINDLTVKENYIRFMKILSKACKFYFKQKEVRLDFS